MTSSWDTTNLDGANSYVTTLTLGVDDDTDVLLVKPTAKDISIFIKNPGQDKINILAINKPQAGLTLADLIPIETEIDDAFHNDAILTSITALVFVLDAPPSIGTIEISILERLR